MNLTLADVLSTANSYNEFFPIAVFIYLTSGFTWVLWSNSAFQDEI